MAGSRKVSNNIRFGVVEASLKRDATSGACCNRHNLNLHIYYIPLLHIHSATLQELRAREMDAREAAAKAAEAERAQRVPINKERVGFRQERARQKQVDLTHN